MIPDFRALLSALCAVALTGCVCAVSTIGGGGGDGGTGGGAGAGGGAGGGGGALRISPRDPTIDVSPGQAPPLQLSATLNGAPVSPTWLATPASIAVIDGTGKLTPLGTAGGRVTVTATAGSAQDAITVTVRLVLTQNGGAGGAADAGAGGVGGVGGEGEGGAVPPATVAVLQGAPTADPARAMLYPYDQTVWPRGILAPLLQWENGARDPDAVAIHLECPTFVYDGTFARTATPFIHHPIPQAAWLSMGDACAGESVQVRLVFAAGGVAYGPLTETWRIAAGFLKGVVYYNSYGSKLALNYPGALPNGGLFGGATLAIKGRSTDPVLVAGGNGNEAQCRVCHVVSADGSALLSQHGDNYDATSHYALKANNAETPMLPADGRFNWGGVSPDGKLLFSNAAPLVASSSAPSALFQVPSGAAVPTTGLPAGLRAGTPVFSPDGRAVAFNWYAGAAAGGAGDQRTLALLRFAAPGAFSGFTALYTPPGAHAAIYPSFLPTGTGVVFQEETQANGRSFGETRSTCDASGPCSEVGAHGELWWVDVATKQARRLDRANGRGALPTAPNGHQDDSTLNFEPTVSPIPSGGYAWVIFTSRRLYGNVATINPYFSDPRFHDLSRAPTPKKLWVAAIDLDAAPGTDPSHPAFYLPAQELLAGNSRGYWSLEPCKADGQSCESGDQCCGGFCRGATELAQVCGSSSGGGCSREFERCTTAADCCAAASGATCVNNRCAGSIN